MSKTYQFTSESVSEGHPDKVADQISDAVLDALLKHDPQARVACETLVKGNMVMVAGEITSTHRADIEATVRGVIRDIGYTDPKHGFSADSCQVLKTITEQSPDISLGVTESTNPAHEQGAGDQGLMFGFACDETQEHMPIAISLSHRLLRRLARMRHERVVSFLGPDAKSQVTIEYRDGRPTWAPVIVLSTQHAEEASLKDVREFVVEQVIRQEIPAELLRKETRFLINPTGRFVVGGPVADCGLTGRKIIVDTYGGYSRHGGGAFSGKDPSKVDRSAAYAARHIAKNIVASGLAKKCEVQVSYAIGVARPTSIFVDTFGTGKVPDERLEAAVQEVFLLTPRGIIESLSLLRPIYRPTSTYGHFGREPSREGHFSWERTDKVEALKKAVS